MFHLRSSSRIVSALAGVALLSGMAVAQNFTFEAPTYNGSAAGTIVTGQDGWYVPVAGSVDGKVFTYAGNAYGVAANPTGGAQFVASKKTLLAFARAQRDGMWGDGLTGCRRACFDLNGLFVVDADSDPNGAGGNNLGSFSIQPYPANGGILLAFWGFPADPNFAGVDSWNLGTSGMYDGNGNAQPAGQIIYFPNSLFHNIAQNTWMRVCVNVDLELNAIARLEISEVGGTTVNFFEPDLTDTSQFFWLGGGLNQLGPITGARLFGGGGTGTTNQGSGNTLAMDNLNIAATCADNPCPCLGNINTNGTSANVIDINDLTSLLAAFGGPVPNVCYDLNTNGTSAGVVDINDLTVLLGRFGSTCQ